MSNETVNAHDNTDVAGETAPTLERFRGEHLVLSLIDQIPDERIALTLFAQLRLRYGWFGDICTRWDVPVYDVDDDGNRTLSDDSVTDEEFAEICGEGTWDKRIYDSLEQEWEALTVIERHSDGSFELGFNA